MASTDWERREWELHNGAARVGARVYKLELTDILLAYRDFSLT